METLLIIIGIYFVGVIIAIAVTCHYIAKFGTKDNPIIGAMFSWLTVIMALVIVPIVKLLMKFPDEH